MPLRVSHVDPACGKVPDGDCVTNPHRPQSTLSRRQALFAGGALVVAYLARTPGTDAAPNAGAEVKPALTPPELDSWLAVKPDSSVVGYFGKVDIGLGIQWQSRRSSPMKLDVGFDRVSIVMGDTAATNQPRAVRAAAQGWNSAVCPCAMPRRRHAVFCSAWGGNTGSPVETLDVTDGVVSVRGAVARRVSYGELIGGRYFDVQLQWNGKIGNDLLVGGTAPLKKHAQYRVVGKSMPRADIRDKLLGREVYNGTSEFPACCTVE